MPHLKILMVLFLVISAVLSATNMLQNSLIENEEKNCSEPVLKRNKRFLVFTNGGTIKFVGGYLGPIDTPSYINANAIRNYQIQYLLYDKIFTKFAHFPKRERFFEGRNLKTNIKGDSSRKIAYKLLETVTNKEGKNGRQCLLRTICEVAETPLKQNGLIGELLHIFFSPGDFENVDEEFKDAKKAGEHGVNCAKLYNQCPFGDGFLDKISVVNEQNLSNFF